MRDDQLKALVNKPRRKPDEFRVGDVVMCKVHGEYTITKPGVKCRVAEISLSRRPEKMIVNVIGGGYTHQDFEVKREHFELLEESQA